MTNTPSDSASSQHSLSELHSRLVRARANFSIIFILSAVIPCAGLGIYSYSQNNDFSGSNQRSSEGSSREILPENLRNNPSASSSSADTSQANANSSDSIRFTGIDLPVTNTLCNKKGNFCIYGLAGIVNAESGAANYTFSDTINGEPVNIIGSIGVKSIEKDARGLRIFTFSFEDNQASTTSGWAASGFFTLSQDANPSKPGILTKFKTTQSFGPKTPVGLENTSYLFPR